MKREPAAVHGVAPALDAAFAQVEGILNRLEALYEDEAKAVAAKDVDALVALSARRRQGAEDAAALAALATRIAALGADGMQAAPARKLALACEALRALAQEIKARTAQMSRSVREGLRALACVRTLSAGGRPAARGKLLDRES